MPTGSGYVGMVLSIFLIARVLEKKLRKVLLLGAEAGTVEAIQFMSAPVSMFAMLADPAGMFTSQQGNNIIAWLLILVLGVALGMGFVCLLLVLHFIRRERSAGGGGLRRGDLLPRERRYNPLLFPAPNRWLAIKSSNPHFVQAALGLHKPTFCSWEEGLSAVHERKLFISPAVKGWILVMGTSLPDPVDDVDRAFRFILALSRKVGHVQFFSVNRAVSHHCWAQVDHGLVQRAYAWAGKTLWNQGRVSAGEMELRLKCYDYAEPKERSNFSQTDPAVFNTERVPLLAARWSVDPATIDTRMLKEAQGIAGELTRSRTH